MAGWSAADAGSADETLGAALDDLARLACHACGASAAAFVLGVADAARVAACCGCGAEAVPRASTSGCTAIPGQTGFLWLRDPAAPEAAAAVAGQAGALLALAAAQARAARYREAFQAAAVDLVLIGVEPDGEFRYEDMNRVHAQNTGLTRDRFIGGAPEDIFPPAVAAAARRTYAAVAATGQPVEYELPVQFPAGERIRRSTMVPLRDASGQIARILLTSIDLTEMRRTEAQLRQAQKMESMGQLTGGLAHDFNNLLTAVIGSLELAHGTIADPKARRRVEIAMRAAQRGGELTRQLLAFARQQRLVAQPIDVNAVLRGLGELLQRTLGGLIAVQSRLAADLWPALADATQVEHAVLNLALNARDAMPEGGQLRVETGNATIAAGDFDRLAQGDYVRIAVADTGAGMAADVLDRAMEPFFTTKEPGKGTGLGLAQVYGLMRQLGGAVRLRSAPGAGTTAELFLPRATAAAAGAAAAPGPRAAGENGGNLIIVDDERDVLEIAAAMLTEAGYRVRAASGGAEALAMLAEAPADLLVLDFAMPGMSGAELARQVQRLHPAVRLLFLTGHAETLPGSNHAVLRKPYTRAALLAAVDATLAVRP